MNYNHQATEEFAKPLETLRETRRQALEAAEALIQVR